MRQRVAEGGHDVPADKIRERYNRTIELLPAAVEIADRVRIYDNSTIPQQAVMIENGQITYQSEEIPNWVQTTLKKLEERASDRSQITTNFPSTSANIDSGKYVGTVRQTTDNYITFMIIVANEHGSLDELSFGLSIPEVCKRRLVVNDRPESKQTRRAAYGAKF